jgi:hypothetical protein
MNRWFMFLRASNGIVIYFLKYLVMTFTRTQYIDDSRITIQFGISKYYIALQLRKGGSIVKAKSDKTNSVFIA